MRLSSLQSATRFTISVPEIVGLGDTYNKLVHLASDHDFVATTALGGVPGLLHLIEKVEQNERPEDSSEWGALYDRLRAKFHLFPGLNWSGTDRESGLLYKWITSLPTGSTLLLFDTGSVGNGARRFHNVILDRCGKESSLGLSRIRILGVVDGEHPSQKPEDTALAQATGRTRVFLDYYHVPRMLSEDCQELLGFVSVRPKMMYRSADASAVFEVVSQSGEHIQSLASMSGASVLRRLLLDHRFPEPGDQEGVEDRMRFVGGLILSYGVREELNMLQNALEFGLIDEARATREARAADARAKATFEKDLIQHWDFVSKKKTRPTKRTDAESKRSKRYKGGK